MSQPSLAQSIVGWLFRTGAIRVSPADSPFWYTSGLIGPYYVNTHFLYGSEAQANQLLQLIDDNRSQPLQCARVVRTALWENYRTDDIFRQVIDAVVGYLRQHVAWQEYDAFSGGERRDWFFSLLPAEILQKPHLMIFKDQQVVSSGEEAASVSELGRQRVLHISDLITEASSYVRAWIPALSSRGAEMAETLTIVDRRQGGREALQQEDIKMHSLVQIDAELFAEAARQGYLSAEQQQLVDGYLADPHGSMRRFLLQHPAFLQQALAAGGKSEERARRLLEQDLYQLGQQVVRHKLEY